MGAMRAGSSSCMQGPACDQARVAQVVLGPVQLQGHTLPRDADVQQEQAVLCELPHTLGDQQLPQDVGHLLLNLPDGSTGWHAGLPRLWQHQ